MTKRKRKIKPESEWTMEDRIAKASMEAMHSGTWQPSADGGLVRTSKRPTWPRVGPGALLALEIKRDLDAIMNATQRV